MDCHLGKFIFPSAINSAILIFSSRALSSLEDLWLKGVDCMLLDIDKDLQIDLPDDSVLPTDTSESLELTAAFLSDSASFIQLWIFCLNANRLCSTSSNHSSSVSCASGCSINLYSLCTSNTILKISSSCCIWSQRDSKFLREYNSAWCLDHFFVQSWMFFLWLVQLICTPSRSWSFFYSTHLNQIDPLWQPLICYLKHLW